MLKWGSQMINAMSNAAVPCISLLIGSSFGAANFAMCGRGYFPRFMFSWPTAKCAVMGPDQLAGVMELLAKERLAKAAAGKAAAAGKGKAAKGSEGAAAAGAAGAGEGEGEGDTQVAMLKAMLKARIEAQMSALNCSQHGLDDGIIDPRETRRVLGMVLSACCTAGIEQGPSTGLARL